MLLLQDLREFNIERRIDFDIDAYLEKVKTKPKVESPPIVITPSKKKPSATKTPVHPPSKIKKVESDNESTPKQSPSMKHLVKASRACSKEKEVKRTPRVLTSAKKEKREYRSLPKVKMIEGLK